METIKLRETVTNRGFLRINLRLEDCVNQEVEVTIKPVKKTKSKKNSEKKKNAILQFAGAFSKEDIEAFETALADCRKIDYESWNKRYFD